MPKEFEESLLMTLKESAPKIYVNELAQCFHMSVDDIISAIKSLLNSKKIDGIILEEEGVFFNLSWDELIGLGSIGVSGICPLSVSEKINMSKDDLLHYITTYCSNHHISALRVPGKDIVIFPEILKEHISKKGIISLSEIERISGISKDDARYTINTLIVTGFRGIYVDETFVTLDFLMDQVSKILQEHGSVGVSALARMLNVDDKVAFNLLVELKRFKVNPNLKIG